MIRIFEAFAGYGTATFALKQLGIEHELVGFSEIDKYAIQCFQQNHCNIEYSHGEEIICPSNYGDISKIDWSSVPDFDLFTSGFPCQSFSNAGKQLGIKDTRGMLAFETTGCLEAKHPKYFMFENVKGLMSKKFDVIREQLIQSWRTAGYNVFYKVLNTREHGIPQNRERVFFIGIRKDLEQGFIFPGKSVLDLKLKDLLEKSVDEKYFLKEEQVEKIMAKGSHKGKEFPCWDRKTYSSLDNKSSCLRSGQGSGNQKLIIDRTKCTCNEGQACKVCCSGCGNYLDECNCEIKLEELTKGVSQAQRIFNPDGCGCTLRALGGGQGAKTGLYAVGCQLVNKNRAEKPYNPNNREMKIKVKDEEFSYAIKSAGHECMVCFKEPTALDLYNNKERTDYSPCISLPHHNSLRLGVGTRVRRLTPKECFRLQGFLGDEVNLDGLSDTQKYKLAGNGQSVNVVKLLFKELLKVGCVKKNE